jgi:DNA polymerase-1
MPKSKPLFIILDAHALIHRAFHAIPPLSTQDGTPINAVYGFTAILLKTIKDLKPAYIAAAFDRKEQTFRHKEYAEYKATRVKAPDELYVQMPLVKDVLEAFNVPIFEEAGYEADDLIGTTVRTIAKKHPGVEMVIVTGDQDALQLVDHHTKVLMPAKGVSETKLFDISAVAEKFSGLKPLQIIDYKALAGDTSDNIPGVRGIGPKGAIDLILDFETIEGIYQNIDSNKIKERTKQLLIESRDNAFLSKRLATIATDAPLDFKLEACVLHDFDKQLVIDLFQKLNFKRLLPQISALGPKSVTTTQQSILGGAEAPKRDQGDQKYLLVNDAKALKKFMSELSKQKLFALDTETTGLDPLMDSLLGISFCWKENEAYYLPTKIIETAKTELAQVFADTAITKIGHNLKFDYAVLTHYGFEIGGTLFDTMIASYILNSSHRQHGLDALAFVEFGYQMQPIEELIGKGKQQITLEQVPIEQVSWYACEDVDYTWRLYEKFNPELKKQKLDKLFLEIEMPLLPVLAKMERIGVKIDGALLYEMSTSIGKQLTRLKKEIYIHAGSEFNVNSPAQLKEILFNKLELSQVGISKTKTGISTAASELEKMRGLHPIIECIFEYRELSKLKSTYLDSLPKLISPYDNRLHTTYNQTIAATGRLSSTNPNLQNIPIRTEIGGQIRQAFVAPKGYKIIKADYSQFELRIVASLAHDQKMIEAFKSGIDIHIQTAAAINGISIDEVSKEQRRQAKEINFGVIYGMGAWGLSQRTGITPKEAQEFIDKYFATYHGIKKYLEETLEQARIKGYVETVFGRRRLLPEINSSMAQARAGAERMAVNMPIQGTQADLIKIAMINLHEQLPTISPDTKMLLQVHDELVFEVPEKEVDTLGKEIKKIMTAVGSLEVPIVVEVYSGDNWGETENLA